MKARLLLLTILAFVTAMLLAFGFGETKWVGTAAVSKERIKCGPDWELLEKYFDEVSIPPIAGSGTHKWKITTSNDSAQFYFNQGINMYYSFHIIESMASFKKAASLDPNSAMLQWAQALAYGPNINDVAYDASPKALAATNMAIELSSNVSPKERVLIDAMQVRYTADAIQSREALNQLYSDKMKAAYEKFPNDADVAVLYADALMLQHPWDLWFVNGTPKPWTPTIRALLEKILTKYPDHPGANHYYIHVMEPSPFASKALPSADRLGRITPALSHTVHMPSHIYLRTGHYNKGVKVNEQAVNSYKTILPLYDPVKGNDFLYVIHNIHMQVNNSMMAGRKNYSVEYANETRNSIPMEYLQDPSALGSYIQSIYMLPLLTDVRFARWQEILQQTKPADGLEYANVLFHFSRGMALTNLLKLDEAKQELTVMREMMKDSVLQLPFTPFSAAIEGAKVGEQILVGSIAMKEKKYADAIVAFSKATTIEENMIYTEPRDWLLNPKHYLGHAYMVAGEFANAEKAFRKDLAYNNENPWALRGLYQSLTAQKKKDAPAVLSRFKKAAVKADIEIKNSILL